MSFAFEVAFFGVVVFSFFAVTFFTAGFFKVAFFTNCLLSQGRLCLRREEAGAPAEGIAFFSSEEKQDEEELSFSSGGAGSPDEGIASSHQDEEQEKEHPLQTENQLMAEVTNNSHLNVSLSCHLLHLHLN